MSMEEPLRAQDVLSGEWMGVLLVLVTGALAWVNTISPQHWRLLRQAFFRLRLGKQTMREDIDLRDRTLVVLLVAAITVVGLFLFQTFFQMSDQPLPPVRVAGFIGGSLAVVLVQWIILRLLGTLFKADGGTIEYLYTMLLLIVMTGLVLLPLVGLVAYQPDWRPVLTGIGLAWVGAMIVFRWVRGYIIGRGAGQGHAYIIFYLCAAEVLPAAIAIRSLQHPLPPYVSPF